MCTEIHGLDPFLLMVKNGIRRGASHTIQRYAPANKNYMKDYNKYK